MRRAWLFACVAVLAGAAFFGTASARQESVGLRGAAGAPWKGTVESDTQRQYVSKDLTWQCTDHWHSDISFVVAADKSVTGVGTATLTSGPTCNAPYGIGSSWATEVDFAITGKKETSDFVLAFVFGRVVPPQTPILGGFATLFSTFPNYLPVQPGPPLTIPLTGATMAGGSVQTSGSITLDASVDPPDPMVSTNVFSLTASCDPNLLAKALREYDTATSFADAGVKELNQAANDLRTFRDDYAKEDAEIAAEKYTLLQILHTLDAGLELDLAQIAELTGAGVGIGVVVEELSFKFYPIYKAHTNLTRESEADFKRAEQWAARADADLKQALAEGPCTGTLENQLNKLLADQNKGAKERNLIDSWNNNGTLYVSPINGEVLDERAALDQAHAIITGKARTPQIAVKRQAKSKLTAKQARAALADLNRAIKDHTQATSGINRLLAADNTLQKRLRPLLSR